MSRSIGDVYLKKPQLNKDLCFSHGGVAISFKKPVLSAEPSLHEKVLSMEDRFLIFASDGLWEHLTDQDAVDVVQKGSRNVCISGFCFLSFINMFLIVHKGSRDVCIFSLTNFVIDLLAHCF